MIWSKVKRISQLAFQFADRQMPRSNGPVPDRTFLYFGGQLDTDCESVEVVYFRDELNPKLKVTVERQLCTSDDHFDRLIDAWMKNKQIPIALQFGGSGKILKTEVLVSDLMIVGSSESSRMVCSLVGKAEPFQ